MVTTVLAWLTVVAACAAAVRFGQTARTAPARGGRRSRGTVRVGLIISLHGPWLVVLGAVAAGALTGQWLVAAVAGLAGVVVAAVVGLVLAPD
jgi:hypothetical protein